MDSRLFRVLRRIGSFPSVLIALGLLIGGISACQAVSQFFQGADHVLAVQSARFSGGR